MKLRLSALFIAVTVFSIPCSLQAKEIKTEVVSSSVYDRHVRLGGSVVPHKEITINAQQAGQVNFISGIEGDRFDAGALLISTDDDILQAQRSAAIAQWQQASFAYKNAVSQLNREVWSPSSEQVMPGMAVPGLMDQIFTRPLSNSMGYGNDAVDRHANVSSARISVKKASAQIRLIEARIKEIDVRLSDTKSYAPFSGVIVEKIVEAGDTVQPGQPLMVFAKSDHLSLEVNVPVNLMLGIKKGTVLEARLSGKTIVPVRVAQVFPVADPQQHTVIVKFDLPRSAPAAPGMYAEVSVINSSSQGHSLPSIPKSAIVKRGSLPSVFVINPSTQAVDMKIIRLGKETNSGRHVVLSGLHDGENIVVNPPYNIVSGWVLVNGRLAPPRSSAE